MSVPALCAGVKELKPLAVRCKVATIPEDTGSDHGRRFIRLARPDVDGTYVPFAHHDCTHNQLIALRNRVLGEVPRPSEDGLKALRKQAWRLLRHLPRVSPDDYFVLPMSYTGAKRAKYWTATERVLENGGINQSDAKVKMFVKFEKLAPKKLNPDPRAIQFRDPKYCVEVARFLKPIEHYLYSMCGGGRDLPNSRVIGKGLSSGQRASLLKHKLDQFESPVILSLDASRFDQHVDAELLKLEHMIYKGMCPDAWFAELLSWQLHNKGISSTGFRYSAYGKRMSGDMNTALGNCVLMVLMVSTFMRGRKYDLLDDGDDCLLIVEEELLEWVLENVEPVFLTYGMEIKIEHIAREMAEVEWCQSHPIEYAPEQWKFVRDPYKVCSTSLSGTKYFTSEGARRKLVNTIGMAELALNLGVPVLQEYALALMRNAGTDEVLNLQESDGMYHRVKFELRALNIKHLCKLDPSPISAEARISFAAAFGMEVSRQLELEEFFKRWSFEISGGVEMPEEWDVARWVRDPAFSPEAYSSWE